MTVNFHDKGNHIQLSGDVLFGAFFGNVCSVIPVSFNGNGHQPHVRVGFIGGVNLDLTQSAAVELARRLPEAIASLPSVPDVSGSAWGGEL